MNRLFLIFGLWAALCVPALAQFNGGGFGQPGFTSPKAVGGAAPTWTPTDIQQNTGCGFQTTCTQAVSITAGFIVVAIGGEQSGTVTDVTACTGGAAVHLTPGPTSGNINGSYDVNLWYGTVSCSGSQNIVATSSAANSWFRMIAAVGTLANLTSTTPTTSCNNQSISVTGNALACSSALTVPASGFGIAFGFQSISGSAPVFSNLTNDEPLGGTGGSGTLGSSSSAGSLTPNMGSLTNTTKAGIVGATWH